MGVEKLLVPAVTATVVVLAGACNSADRPNSVDISALVEAIPAELVPEYPEAVTDVVCPEIVFDGLGPVLCTAFLAGSEIRIKVTRPDVDGQMKVSTAVKIVYASDVAEELGGRLSQDLGDVEEVGCEPGVRVARSGEQFICRVTDRSRRTHRFITTLAGPDGEFRADLVPRG